ncbi:MAG: AAA family ATPase [Actinomycetota bacterium]|nr:AAA family ATPase [Actinomycetota bacterium]
MGELGEHPKTCTPAEAITSAPASADPRPKVWKATDLLAARRVEWLANRRIVAGATNYMLGPEGIGKSLFLTWLTALVTTGRPFPEFGLPARAPRIVVLVLTEDDWATIARPRLEVAGADLNFVRVICAEEDGSGSPVFPEDMAVVEAAASNASVVIVDAWADTLPGSLSVKDPQQARQALHPWKELATRTGVAVLLSGHTNREKGGNVRNVYGLSGEIRKKARMTLLAQPDQDEDGVLVIGPEKTNVTAPVAASRFRIEAVPVFAPTDDSDGTVPRLVWIGDAEQSARDFFADSAAAEHGDGTEDRNDVDEWLRGYLATGSQKANEVYSAADANGFSKDQVKRSKKRIGAVADRPTNPGPWFWSLPGPKHGAGGTQPSLPPSALSALPVLPASSEGMRQGAERAGSREQEIRDTAPCGHPIKAVNTSNGKCGQCIAERPADPARAAAEERGRALRLAVGA